MTRLQLGVVWLLLLLTMGSCQTAPLRDELDGRITLWHSWSPEEAAVLDEALAEFQEIHPRVRIVDLALPEGQILTEFYDAGIDGLGPSLLIGTDSWIGELASSGLIRPLSLENTPPALLNSRNSALAQFERQLFGIPLFLSPYALYYNKSLVTDPPETLDELLQEAAAGNRVAFVPRFQEAYWGIQAFGEGLFDAQGRLDLAEGGLSQWLRWLDEAQRAPGMILSVDDQSLLQLFTSGQIAYYVAGPEKLSLISAMMSEDSSFDFGVAPLPGGPHGAAGPLLSAETVLVYAFNSPQQRRIATELASFLVNRQQGIRFMRELNRIPANPAIWVDRRLYPIVSGFARQAETAVIIPNEIPIELLAEAGDRAYISVLSGVLSPTEAVCQFGQEIAALPEFRSVEIRLPAECESPDSDVSQNSTATTLAYGMGAHHE